MFDVAEKSPAQLVYYDPGVATMGAPAAITPWGKALTRVDNRYCWVCRFVGDLIVEVRAYLDSAMAAYAVGRVDALSRKCCR